MTAADQFAVILDLAVQLRKNGSWAGETHVQKGAYVLQELLGVPAGFEFVLYKHGPFSFDLREALNEMEAERIIELHERPYPYGPTIAEGRAAPRIMGRPAVEPFRNEIEFISRQLGSARVGELERVATALFIMRDKAVPPEQRAKRLVQLKPHVSLGEAEGGFKRLDEIRTAAVREGFRPVVGRISITATQSAQPRS